LSPPLSGVCAIDCNATVTEAKAMRASIPPLPDLFPATSVPIVASPPGGRAAAGTRRRFKRESVERKLVCVHVGPGGGGVSHDQGARDEHPPGCVSRSRSFGLRLHDPAVQRLR